MTRSDSDLVTAARGGDRDAFGAIVGRYQRSVVAVVYAVTGDRVLADDIAQEVFVIAWRDLARLADPARLPAWLCGIARKRALHTLRWRRRETTFDVEPIAANTPFEQLAEHQREQLVGAALARVPDTYRDALVLYYGDGRSADAVARALGISVDAANQRLSRGRAHLAADAAIAVERQLERRPRRDLVAGVLALIAGGAIVSASSSASAAASSPAPARASRPAKTGAKVAAATGASKLLLAAAAAVVLAGTGYLASVARATPQPDHVDDRAESMPAQAVAPAPPPSPAARPAPALPPDAAANDNADEPVDLHAECNELGKHLTDLVAAGEPADTYHPLRDWIPQDARLAVDRCLAWSAESRRCVADAQTMYDVIFACKDLQEPTHLSLGKRVEPETGDDLSCAHVEAHLASLYQIDPDRLAAVPAKYRDTARQWYEVMSHEQPAQFRHACEDENWSETTRRCYLLARADYLLGCASN